jgi:membrane associated rhomboid family serine protease
MGILDRDYYRESSIESWGRRTTTNSLIAATVVTFLAQILTHDFNGGRHLIDSPVTQFGLFNTEKILQGEAWRLVTPLFLHADLWHLVFNMLVLWWAGNRVEELYGRREFLFFYLAAGIFASVVDLALQASGALHFSQALGASGAVTAVLVLYACHDPFHPVAFFMIISMPLWLLVVIYVGMDLMGSLGMGHRGIGYVAHLGGAAFGFTYYRSGLRFHQLVPGWPRSRRATPNLRVVHPEEGGYDEPEPVPAAYEPPPLTSDEPFESKVDRVLEKVSRHGQESLSPEEREILFRAGEVYKRRRK